MTPNHLYINAGAYGCINEASVGGNSPTPGTVDHADAEVKGEEYETQHMEMMIKDGETVAPELKQPSPHVHIDIYQDSTSDTL